MLGNKKRKEMLEQNKQRWQNSLKKLTKIDEDNEIIELAEKLIIAYTSNPETVTRASPQNICETSYQLAEQFIDYKKQWLSERETK